jgi:biopolymer transport protein ExbB
MNAIILITDVVEKLILLSLFGLSVWSISIMIDRKRFFKSEDEALKSFSELKKNIDGKNNQALESFSRNKTQFLPQALSVILSAPQNPESIDRAVSSFAKAEKQNIEKGLAVLATLGANAPFIGLFGTVLGIIRAFAYLGSQSGSSAVMSGVSQALYATAFGLFVAIPAVVAFNLFSKKMRDLLIATESLKDLYVSKLGK